MIAAEARTAVVDTSALIPLLIDPSDQADLIADALRGVEWCAPTVLSYEVTNVLGRMVAGRLLSPRDARDALLNFEAMSIELWPWAAVSDGVWRHVHNLTAYDGAYVALAERLAIPLITADRRLAAAVGIECEVILLA